MPSESQTLALLDCFAEVSDPRIDRCQDHLLIDILFIAIGSLICGGDDFTDMQEFGLATESWLRQFLELKKRHSFTRHLQSGVCPPRPQSLAHRLQQLDGNRARD